MEQMIGKGSGMLPDSTKLLHEPMLTSVKVPSQLSEDIFTENAQDINN